MPLNKNKINITDIVLLRYRLHAGVVANRAVLQHVDSLDLVVFLQLLSRPITLDPMPSQREQHRSLKTKLTLPNIVAHYSSGQKD